MKRSAFSVCLSLAIFAFFHVTAIPVHAQTITATLEGTVYDSSGGVVPKASVSAKNSATSFTRSTSTDDNGFFRIPLLPVGEYTVSVEREGFASQARRITLEIGQIATLNFTLQVGAVSQQVQVAEDEGVLEPTRTAVTTVINPVQIENLPVNGRQFIDFVLLAPGVSIGDTTSGSTDVIVEPVTKISFASQNIHLNFVAIDGADNMSTASGIQKTTPSQEAVQEFRVLNADYTTEFGRSAAGVVNIITKSGTNEIHGSLYSFFRNDAFDATSILSVPGFDTLHQYQYGGSIGGPIIKDRTFFFFNYEGQRRNEAPFYNSTVLENIDAINATKVNLYGLRPEDLTLLRDSNADNILARVDHQFSQKHNLFVRYFFNDARFTNVSPLNDGFDLPSAFKNNFLRDNSLVGNLTSALTSTLINDFRVQYARRSFDFPVVSTEPHLEVGNTFTSGVNRGNPDFYNETRIEVVEKLSLIRGRHNISFGGNFNWVRTTESFPLFYPFEADFATLNDWLNGTPFVIFFERFQAPGFNEPTIPTSVYQAGAISDAIRNQAKGRIDHTYNGLFVQDKIRATNRLTLNLGLRWEFETWPSEVVNNDLNNFDPRIGFAYNVGTSWNMVIRGGAGFFHGNIPSPLLSCQIPSCGGQAQYPGREDLQNDINSTNNLFAFASSPFINNLGLLNLLGQPNLLRPAPGGGGEAVATFPDGIYPDAVDSQFLGCPGQPFVVPPVPPGTLAGCAFFGESVIVRFNKDHQAPLAYQMGLSLEFQPLPNFGFSASWLRVRGTKIGSFWNVNQPDPTGQVTVHDSSGNTGLKNTYFCPVAVCGPGIPGTRDPRFAVYFEADSRWDSIYDGFFLTATKRAGDIFNFQLSYTWSKGLDNGPNPSFVLIPQDSQDFKAEKALSADHAAHRFTGNATFHTPDSWGTVGRNFLFSSIVTIESPHYFTKFAGFDANGDIFGNNDRVGIEPRNTFKGDSLRAVDMRIARTFQLNERFRLQLLGEVFNLFNTLNVKFFNTAYGASDFCPVAGPAVCGAGPLFVEGSPNPAYGTPRAVYNPRQIQFAARFSF